MCNLRFTFICGGASVQECHIIPSHPQFFPFPKVFPLIRGFPSHKGGQGKTTYHIITCPYGISTTVQVLHWNVEYAVPIFDREGIRLVCALHTLPDEEWAIRWQPGQQFWRLVPICTVVEIPRLTFEALKQRCSQMSRPSWKLFCRTADLNTSLIVLH